MIRITERVYQVPLEILQKLEKRAHSHTPWKLAKGQKPMRDLVALTAGNHGLYLAAPAE